MDCKDTLRIRNLPNALSDNEKEDFIRHFGALEVKILTSKIKHKCVAFAKFETSQIAKAVLHRLHQVKVLDSILCVEYAANDFGPSKIKLKTSKIDKINNRKHYKAFVSKLNAFNNSVSFNQPPPNHLNYNYPLPNRATINNIAHALASIPKFYTQVLHLMNRMNLPPPFSDVPDTPQIATRVTPPQINKKDSSESEIESDPETDNKIKDIIPIKRTLPQKKLVKRPKFIKIMPLITPLITPITTNKEISDDIFEKSELQSRKIELKVNTECLQNRVDVVVDDVGSFGFINEPQIIPKPIEAVASPIINAFISEAELEANRIPLKDLNVLPVFNEYHPGPPSCRLYIKNIAKSVDLNDMEFIYKRYLIDTKEASLFDIRLMQEGRMKGQAFVTLDSVETAQKAVKETNGFILKDKPLVVVFARSAVPKK